jgi:outer membrane protein assembly factor BamD (BamD/ComL family)
MLERARAAMGSGELARALSILDGYAVRYARGAMAPEAAVLRIETLVKMGDRPAATRFANAFLAREPHSPYASRIQSLIAAPTQ